MLFKLSSLATRLVVEAPQLHRINHTYIIYNTTKLILLDSLLQEHALKGSQVKKYSE